MPLETSLPHGLWNSNYHSGNTRPYQTPSVKFGEGHKPNTLHTRSHLTIHTSFMQSRTTCSREANIHRHSNRSNSGLSTLHKLLHRHVDWDRTHDLLVESWRTPSQPQSPQVILGLMACSHQVNAPHCHMLCALTSYQPSLTSSWKMWEWICPWFSQGIQELYSLNTSCALQFLTYKCNREIQYLRLKNYFSWALMWIGFKSRGCGVCCRSRHI